eukprot:3777955-Amphidinium_carterae.2
MHSLPLPLARSTPYPDIVFDFGVCVRGAGMISLALVAVWLWPLHAHWAGNGAALPSATAAPLDHLLFTPPRLPYPTGPDIEDVQRADSVTSMASTVAMDQAFGGDWSEPAGT